MPFMVHVTRREIEKSFRKHKSFVRHLNQSGRYASPQRKMILFYAVECGLKSLYMKRKCLQRTDQKDSNNKSVSDFSHNLNRLLKKLNLIQHKLPDVMAVDSISIPAKSLHEAWRYGKELDAYDERKYEEKLQKIMQIIDRELK
ncbi:MAG: hypothetical protein DRI57_20150 [Deltaproteobacteria bacterium]|nr:MAG: hypothetical protein DRI57_20150 [Deltaproteobacteria bacterium]